MGPFEPLRRVLLLPLRIVLQRWLLPPADVLRGQGLHRVVRVVLGLELPVRFPSPLPIEVEVCGLDLVAFVKFVAVRVVLAVDGRLVLPRRLLLRGLRLGPALALPP